MHHIMPMLLTVAANQDTDPDASVCSLRDLGETLGFARHDLHAYLEALTLAGVLHWVGYEVRCPGCGAAVFLGSELPLQLVCDDGTFPIAACVLDDLYRLALPLPVPTPQAWTAQPLAILDLVDAITRGLPPFDGMNGAYSLLGALPADRQIQIAEPGIWYLSPILGRLAFHTYGARSALDYRTLAPTLVHDLGGAASYDAVATIQQQLVPSLAAHLIGACATLGDLPQLATFVTTTHRVPAWRVDRAALAASAHLDLGRDAYRDRLAAQGSLGPSTYVCFDPAPLGLPSEPLSIWVLPATAARRAQAERTLVMGWSCMGDHLGIEDPTAAWHLYAGRPALP